MTKPDSNGITPAIGLAGNVASMIPGMGAISGILGLGGNVLSWILGTDEFDWEGWKKNQLAGIDREYDTSLSNATSVAHKTANATIGEATNKQAMAGGVAGINNPGRLNAQTYANVAQNRDDAITSITNGLEQNRAAMKSAVIREASQGQMQEQFNQPTTIDYMNNLLGTLQTPVGQEGVGAIVSGIGKGADWLGNLFRGNKKGGTFGVTPGMQNSINNTANNSYISNFFSNRRMFDNIDLKF